MFKSSVREVRVNAVKDEPRMKKNASFSSFFNSAYAELKDDDSKERTRSGTPYYHHTFGIRHSIKLWQSLHHAECLGVLAIF